MKEIKKKFAPSLSSPLLFLFHLVYPPSSSIRKEIQFSFCIAFRSFSLSPNSPFPLLPIRIYNFFLFSSSPNHFHLLLFTLIRKGIPPFFFSFSSSPSFFLIFYISFSLLPTKYPRVSKVTERRINSIVRGCLIRRH